jgi:hypothetical protein
MDKIYFITESEDYEDRYGFAFSDDNISPGIIQNWNNDIEWANISFELRGGDFADYIVNDLNIPLCSEKLKKIIQNKNSNQYADNSFYSVHILKEKEKRLYYFLKADVLADIIDMENSIIENNTIMVPYFKQEKIKDIFRCDYDPSYLFVTESLMNKIKSKNITGIDFYTWNGIQSR